jgi:hypothetical protein
MTKTRDQIQTNKDDTFTAPQSEVIVLSNILDDVIEGSLNLISDKDLLGVRPYNASRSYETGENVTFNDGANNQYEANKTTTGVFVGADWDIVGSATAALDFTHTIVVSTNGSDSNTGRNFNNAVLTPEKAIDIHNASGHDNVIILTSLSHGMAAGKTINTGLSIVSNIGSLFDYKRLTANATGGIFTFKVNGVTAKATGGEILYFDGTEATLTTFDLDLKGNKLDWSQQQEGNGMVNVLDTATIHVVNCDVSNCSGSRFVISTDKATTKLIANNCEAGITNQSTGMGSSLLTVDCYDSQLKGGLPLIKSTSTGGGSQTITGTINIGNTRGDFSLISEVLASGNGVYTVRTTGNNYSTAVTVGGMVSNASVPTFNGPGVIEASDGVLYNGSNSLQNRVVVKKASDFGVIDSDKQYFIDGVIDMGSTVIEVPSGGIGLHGYDFNRSKLISSENSYTMFTSPGGGSGDILGMDYAIEVTGTASKVYDLVADTGLEAFEFTRINFNNCTSLGEISGYRQGLEIGTGRFGGQPELTLSGTWLGGYFIDTSIVRNLVDGAYSLFKAGAAFVMNSRFRSNQNIDINALVSFFDFSAGNFPNSSTLQLNGCIITRNGLADASDATIIPNISDSELPSAWTGNLGIMNTFVGGGLAVSSEVETVISISTVFVPVNATWATSNLSHFDTPSSGQLRHLGVNPIEFKVQTGFIIDGPTGEEVAVRITVWDDSESSFVNLTAQTRQVNALVGGRDVAFFTILNNLVLDTNDYMFFEVANNSTTANLTLELNSSFQIEER